MRAVGKLINSINNLLVTQLVISYSSRDTRAFLKNPLLRLSSWLRHILKRAGNKISRAHGNTDIFIRFATAVFVTSRQNFFPTKIPLDMSRGRKLAWYSSAKN